jgi:manganese-dependent ADP-ribose/CDP-alcohol diphosphatase
LLWTRKGRISMFNDQKGKKRLQIKLKCLTAAAALGIALTAVSPTTSAFAKSDEKPKFEFGIVPDAQYWNGDASGVRYYRNSLDKLMEASQTFNKQDVDFTVQTGDLIDRNIASFSTILPIYNMIEGPKYHVLGNHDFPVTTDQVVDILGMPNQYYDFKYKNWRFVVLDTNDLSLYANPVGSEKHQQAEVMYNSLKSNNEINAQTWNGGVSDEQLTWLRGVLDKAAQTNEKVVVLSHMPVYPANEHNVWNDEEVIQELEEAGNVVAYFNGHNHAGNYGVKNGIHYVNLKGMVDTADTNSYSIVRVYKDRLEVDGFGRETDRVLEIQ